MYVATAEPLERIELRPRLDTLGNDLDSKAVAEGEKTADDSVRRRITDDFLYERPIDFDRVKRETAKVAQARIADSKVVERNSYSVVAQALRQFQYVLSVLDQHAFGDFELQPTRA